jgi:hypothetical protein
VVVRATAQRGSAQGRIPIMKWISPRLAKVKSAPRRYAMTVNLDPRPSRSATEREPRLLLGSSGSLRAVLRARSEVVT